LQIPYFDTKSISHDLLSVAALCHRIAILNEGEIAERAAPQQIFGAPQHPYTQRLVTAIPVEPLRPNRARSAARFEREQAIQDVLS
jgi:ABC-type dipeptide/oligopeptide/nickel transport system ATPase component